MHWDDLRVAAAILRHGSYAKAAKQLGLNETTVSRRLARLEKDLGYRIFQSVDGERTPTEAGRRVLNIVQGMKKQSERLSDLVGDGKPIARRRIAATQPLVNHYLTDRLPRLLLDQPHLNVSLHFSTENASFSRWETDLAIRLARPERGNIVIRKLSSFEWIHVGPADDNPAFGFELIRKYMTDQEWEYQEALLSGLPIVSLNGIATAKRLLETGQCAGIIPSYMCGDLWSRPDLKLEPIGSEQQVWLLIQEHLRHDPDTRIVATWIEDCFDEVGKGRVQ